MDAELGAKLRHLVDGSEIFECLKRVSRGIDRFDRDLFLSAYHPDAVIDAGALVGPPDVVFDGGAALHESGQASTLHHLTNHRCEIEGDTAHAETYFLYVGRNKDATNWAAGGRYVDRLERRDGAWRIAFRFTIIEWSGMVPTNEVPLFEAAEGRHLNGTPSRSRADPSYCRPFGNRRAAAFPADIAALGHPKR